MKFIIRTDGSVVNLSNFESLYVEVKDFIIEQICYLYVGFNSNKYILNTYGDEKSARKELEEIIRAICVPGDVVYKIRKSKREQ